MKHKLVITTCLIVASLLFSGAYMSQAQLRKRTEKMVEIMQDNIRTIKAILIYGAIKRNKDTLIIKTKFYYDLED